MPDSSPEAPTAAPLAPAAGATVQRLREDLIHPDPLLDCLVEICRLQGKATTRAALSAGLPTGPDTAGRLPLELAERAAARAGMATRLQRLALDQLDAATLPVLILIPHTPAGAEADAKPCPLLHTSTPATPGGCWAPSALPCSLESQAALKHSAPDDVGIQGRHTRRRPAPRKGTRR